MGKDAKLLRGQVRIAVKEVLPEVLDNELAKAIHSKLQLYIQQQLHNLEKEVKSFLLRNTPSTPVPASVDRKPNE